MSKTSQANQSNSIPGKKPSIGDDFGVSEAFDKLMLNCQANSADPLSTPEQYSSPSPDLSSNLEEDQPLSTPALFIPNTVGQSYLTLDDEKPKTADDVFSNILQSIADDRVVVAYKVC